MCACALSLVALLSACSATHSEEMLSVYDPYDQHDFIGAEAAINERLADESGMDEDELAVRGLPLALDASSGDVYLLLLEKAMIRLAQKDAKSAVEILRECRDQLDDHFQEDLSNFMVAALSDDRALDYAGADYEHILVRVMLCLCDLIAGNGDAYAYALQVGERQEEIIDSPLSAGDYQPRKRYSRVAIGAWLQGMILEADNDYSGAQLAYERALSYDPGLEPLQLAVERVKASEGPAPGFGVVNVIYLGGRGPTYVEAVAEPTSTALKIAGIAATLVTGTLSPAVQPAEVPVPALDVADRFVRGLDVSVPGDEAKIAVTTHTVLDVNLVAEQQLEAMMPMIEGRAVLRRVIKASAGAVGESAGYQMMGSKDGGTRAAGAGVAILSIVGSALWAAAERADTRSWGTLPSQFQAGRLEVPEGIQTLTLGDGTSVQVRVRNGYHSYVLVVRPNLGKPGVAMVDANSQP